MPLRSHAFWKPSPLLVLFRSPRGWPSRGFPSADSVPALPCLKKHGRTTIDHDWPGRLSGLCAKYRSKEERGIRAHHDLVQFINRNTQLSFDALGLSGKEIILVSWKTTEVRRHHKNLMCLVPPETLKFIIYWECWAPASEESLLFHIVWSVNAYQKWTKCLFQAAAETCMTSQLDLGRAETMDAKNLFSLCMSTPVGSQVKVRVSMCCNICNYLQNAASSWIFVPASSNSKTFWNPWSFCKPFRIIRNRVAIGSLLWQLT